MSGNDDSRQDLDIKSSIPAPRTFDNLPKEFVLELEEPVLPDDTNSSPVSSKSGTLASIKAFCPYCSSGDVLKETTHAFMGLEGDYARVYCPECEKIHKIPWIVKTSE